MDNSFSARIRNIEARLNQLKSFGLKSSSSIKTTSKTITFQVEIVPYKVNYEWDNCASKYSYRIHVSWVNARGLCSVYVKSPTDLAARRYDIERTTNSSYDCEFSFNILSGSNNDLDTFNNGGTVAPFNVTLEVVATADFGLSYTPKQEH